ncbi:glycosyltransferase family 2 protein [Haloglomus litoreum]|uniref:glycosyltransferase family 2 protein n=1 Tax=Haloglomus litoreum TaxID=3034026 RepID=UPI0023E82633|nr:glycosyltransferase family 2 protein [Haloglomus sp. DT116]
MYDGKTIGAVIPAYNEEGFVGDVIETLPPFVDRAYVVDDGSTDGTWAEILEHARAVNDRTRDREAPFDRRVLPVKHASNAGVGAAIKTGYRRALADGVDVTAVIAGDGQTQPDIVERIVAPVATGEAGYAKGNRLLGADRSRMPRHRQVGNGILSLLTKIASGYWRVLDPQNGSTAISHEALAAIDIDAIYEGYGYCNDILVRCNVHGIRVADVQRRAVYEDETSHISYRTYIPLVSSLLLRDFLWRLGRRYVVDDTHPLAGLYLLGAATTGGSLGAALADRLREPERRRGNAPVLFVLGTACLLSAMAADRAENRDLDVIVRRADHEPPETVEPDEDRTKGNGAAVEAGSDGAMTDGEPVSPSE